MRQMIKKPQMISYWQLYRYATRQEVGLNALAVLAAIFSAAALPLTTLVFSDLVDSFAKWQFQPAVGALISAEELMSQVNKNVLYFVYLSVASFVGTYTFMTIFVYTGQMSSHRIRQEYLKSVLRQDIAWFDTIGAGEVASTITTDTLLISDGIGEKFPLAVYSVCCFIFSFAIAFYRSWKLTLVLLAVIPFIAVSLGVTVTVNGKFETRILSLYSIAGNIAEETIAAVRTVVSFNAQKKVAALYGESLISSRKEGIKKAISTGLGLGMLYLFLYNLYALAFWYGHVLVKDDEIKVGTVVNVLFAVLIGAFSLGNLAPDLQAFSLAVGAGSNVFKAIDRVPLIDVYSKEGVKLDRKDVVGRIEFKNVNFCYPARQDVQVLKNFSLVIEPGTTVALVGESGSGKSTVVKFIERFYDPDSGRILLDNHVIPKLNVSSLRHHIGLVSQEPVLFEGTVLENVLQGLAGTPLMEKSDSEKRLLATEACKQANAHDFISALPEGYDTQVGERGMLLSGGQKQRVAIARAIIKDPKILLLDEATSALDTTSERVVQDALDRVSKNRTTITIAHRLSTIRRADKIVVMVKGEKIEEGTHDELVHNRGLYFRLVEAQEIDTHDYVEVKADDTSSIMTKKSLSLRRPGSLKGLNIEDGIPRERSTLAVMKQIAILNLPELKYTIPGLIASIGSGLMYPFFAISFGELIEIFSKRGDELTQEATRWSLVFVAIAVASFSFAFLMNTFFGIASELLTERVRKLLYSAILRQDMSFFDEVDHSTGSLAGNLANDTQKVKGVSGSILGALFQLSTNILGGAAVSFYFSWKMASVGVSVIPILVISGLIRISVLTRFSNMNKKAYEKSGQLACESVAAIKTVQSLGREHDVLAKYSEVLEEPHARGKRAAFLTTMLYAFTDSVSYLIFGLIFWYGGTLIAYEGYTIKQYFTTFITLLFGSLGAARIFAYSPDFSKARDAARDILDLLESRPFIDAQSTEGDKVSTCFGHIKFHDVKFKYPTRPEITVLKGLNIEVKPGNFIALVGSSGSGKSTVVSLVERFYDPSSGYITLDGKHITRINVPEYRNIIGLVSQEPNLFNMSIRDNIAFGLDYVPTEKQIVDAAKEANIHDFIMSLPEGYDTSVGAKGDQMSGGQKQRIAIARALIKKPKVLLLDEATSALDAESEEVVQKALDKASRGRTTIAIAHRLCTIQNADLIYVLQNGVVVEQGTHSELYSKRGVYYELAVQQNLNS